MRSSFGALNSYDYLQGVLHFCGTLCARRKQLESVAAPYMYELGFSAEGIAVAGNRVAQELEAHPQDVQLRRLRSEIVTALDYVGRETNERLLVGLSLFEQSQATLDGFADKVVKFYRKRGLELPKPRIFFVDKIPRPFEDGVVVALDSEDEKRFGIPEGIYFTQAALTPMFAEYTVAHELVHTVLGKASPQLMATKFEEGVADFVAIFDYMRDVYGAEVALNTVKIHRLTSAAGLVWDHYVDDMRATLKVVSEQNISALYTAISAGRAELESLHRRDTKPRSVWQVSDPQRVAADALLAFPRHRVVSALAFEVALAVREGSTIVEIASEVELDRDAVSRAISELEEHYYLRTRSDGLVVEYTTLPDDLAHGELRYDFRAI